MGRERGVPVPDRMDPPERVPVRKRRSPGHTNVTINDVASTAGVSPATVSRVLNGSYPVATTTREQVTRVVHELGYIRNAHAQALRGNSIAVVGVIIHSIADPYFSEIVAGIQDVANEAQRLVVLCNSSRNALSELKYIEMLRGQRVSAVILAGGAIEDPTYLRDLRRQTRSMQQEGVRMVICGRYSSVVTDVVVPDNRGGAQKLTQYVVDMGHRYIGEITGPANFSTTQERSLGHRAALELAGINRPDSMCRSGGFTRDGGYEATRALLASGQRMTAIFAANDLMAVGALAALREANLRVPQDVSVVGFDDISTVRDVVPPLTTARVPMREMGRRSMQLALERTAQPGRIEVMPVEVVERDSVARSS